MASEKSNSGKTVVRRVKAAGADSDSRRVAKVADKPTAKIASTSKKPVVRGSRSANAKTPRPRKKSFVLLRPFFAIGRYFRDSWRELRQVRWTNRKATWQLTLAVILFSAFFAIFVLLFDWLFQWIVKEVIL